MLTLSEKLKTLMNNFSEEMQKVKNWYLANANIYSGNELNRQSEGKKKEILARYEPEALNLQKLIDIDLINYRKSLRAAKYPLLFSGDQQSKNTAELQIAEAGKLVMLDDPEEAKTVLDAIELALSLERFDLVSFVHDSLRTDDLRSSNPELLQGMQKAMAYIIDKQGASQIQKNLIETDENSQICKQFVERLRKQEEFIPYPLTQEFIKLMPVNAVTAQLEKVNKSLEIRGMIKPTNFSILKLTA